MGKKTVIGLVSIVALVFVLGIIVPYGASLLAGPWIRTRILAVVRDHCADCSFDLRDVRVAPFASTAMVHDVRYDSRGKGGDLIQASVAEIRVDIDWWKSLSRRELDLGKITLTRLEVRLVERPGDTLLTKDAPSSEAPGVPPLRVAGLEILDSRFTYQDSSGLNHALTTNAYATIRVEDIDAHVSEFGFTPDLRDRVVTAHARAKLGSAGQVLVTLKTPLRAPPDVSIEIAVRDQDLRVLDAYLMPKEGIAIRGDVRRATASLRLEGERLRGQVEASYRDLDVDFRKTHERTAIESIAQNVVKNFAVHKEADTFREKPATGRVVAQKKAKEPYVGFVFRGMKEAALKIVTS